MSFQATWTQRVVRTQAIMSAAWYILKEDLSLLLLPIASSLCLLLLVGSYLVPTIIGWVTDERFNTGIVYIESRSQAGLFLFYLVTYATVVFFNAALAACVLGKLEGREITIVHGLKEAWTCVPQIVGWAVLSATIGLVIKTIERRSGFLGNLIVQTLGVAWSVATFLVVPVLVAEKKGPFEAVQASVQLVKRTWGEDVLAGLGFGALYFVLAIPGGFVFVVGAGMITSQLPIAIIVMSLAILYFPFLGLILSTMSTIFDVVLYRYAKLGTITPGFDGELLKASFPTRSV